MHVGTWFIYESDQWVIADRIAHLGSTLRSDEAAPCMPSASPGVLPDLMGENLDIEGGLELSDIPASGVIDICSILRGDLLLIQEKGGDFSLDRPSNAGDIFQLALCGLETLAEQLQLLSCVD